MTFPNVTPLPPPARENVEDLEIRHVRTHGEFDACVDLQLSTWGAAFREVVPASMLKITQRLGGVTVGAFASDGRLLGFVFGITGIEHGDIVHWSDMLAVRDEMQGQGVGRKLKEFQREAVQSIGAVRMYWTFDPLVARNAHFNLSGLGARVSEYVPDMYGTNTGSALHNGFGTDRFIAVWPIRANSSSTNARWPGPLHSPAIHSELQAIPVINDSFDHGSDGAPPFATTKPPHLRIEIPADIFRVNADSADEARHWRATTRRAFQWAFASGYVLERFERGGSDQPGFYVLARTGDSAAP